MCVARARHGARQDDVVANMALTLAAVQLSAACPVQPCLSLTGTGFQR